MATWTEVLEIAKKLGGVVADGSIVSVGEQTFLRFVDDKTAMFALGENEDRDAKIAAEPNVWFVTKKFEDLPVVLAHLDAVDFDRLRELVRDAWRTHATPEIRAAHKAAIAAPKQAKAEALEQKAARKAQKLEEAKKPAIYYLGYHIDEGAPEKRVFLELARGTVAEWLLRSWRAYRAGKGWVTDKLPTTTRTDIEHKFDRASDEGATMPADATNGIDTLRQWFSCDAHFMSGGWDDDEDTYWEFFIFDDVFMKTDESDYLPHPERADRKKPDAYRAFLAKHKKHVRTSARKR